MMMHKKPAPPDPPCDFNSKLANVEFTGIKGKYTFQVFDWKRQFTILGGSRGAVYFFTRCRQPEQPEKEQSHDKLYLGRTKDLYKRIGDSLKHHHVRDCIINKKPDYICILWEADKTKRKKIERYGS